MAKNFILNLRKHVMNKCWKFQANILIYIWFRAKRLKICCNQWTHIGQMDSSWPIWVHWLQQIFSHLALSQTSIEISAWNFHHLFITCLRKFDIRILAIAQSACLPRPISAETLDASSNHICWDISKRKKWWGSGPIRVTSWKDFSISLKKWRFEIFRMSSRSTFTMSTHYN